MKEKLESPTKGFLFYFYYVAKEVDPMDLDETYELIKAECKGLSTIYEDAIIQLVGRRGLNLLTENNLITDCGPYHGRQMYVLHKEF
jgi:hypothetical protein